jgi:hypothetical protein
MSFFKMCFKVSDPDADGHKSLNDKRRALDKKLEYDIQVRVARLNTAVIDHDVYEPLPPKRAFTK